MTILYRACLTPIGRSKQADFINGGLQVQVSHIAVDDGGGVPVDYTPITTALANEVARYPVTRVYRSGEAKVAELVLLPNPESYWIRGYGVIDEDGDLIAVVSVPEREKPSTDTGVSLTIVVSIALTVTDPDAFTLSVLIDPSGVMATQASLNAAIANLPAAWPDSQKLGGQLPSYYARQSDLASALPTGSEMGFWGSVAPAGYVLASGRTIGNSASGGTERANADTEALFTLLWNSTAQAELPIQTSAGGASTRGASAAADFAANKRLPLPDMRGRVGVGKDDMGGTSANRLTTAGAGLDGDVMGNAGGTEAHTLTAAQIPAHTHTASTNSTGAHTHTVNFSPTGNQFTGSVVAGAPDGTTNVSGLSSSSAGAHSHTVTVDASTGGGGAHPNLQPSIVRNVIIKL